MCIFTDESKPRKNQEFDPNDIVAMDCEMVCVGAKRSHRILARVSIVNRLGEVLMDSYVRPTQTVTDYRTPWSGIRAKDIKNAEYFSDVKAKVINLLQGRILVGHALCNDLRVLFIEHPGHLIRDTSNSSLLRRKVGMSDGQAPSLKKLAECILDRTIQNGEHSSIEDARATMDIYNKLSEELEQELIESSM